MNQKLEVINRPLARLLKYSKNAKIHDEENVAVIVASIKEFGFCNPVLIDAGGEIIAGHGRVAACEVLGYKEVPCIVLGHLTEVQKQAYRLADNRLVERSVWDLDLLAEELSDIAKTHMDYDLLLTGFMEDEITALLENNKELLAGQNWAMSSVTPKTKTGKLPSSYGDKDNSGELFRKFIVPPFSVLNTQSKYWQDRKKIWTAKIGDIGETREGTLGKADIMEYISAGVSVLDPVMAEVLCRWFAMPGHSVYDPFAGDTVFGFVAASCGLVFKGTELRKEQADLNQQRCADAGLNATYFNDDALNMDKHIPANSQDMIFTCPPYADLEVYSDNPADLSNMSHEDFFKVFGKVLKGTYSRLRNNRFAVVVISEVRDKAGNYIGLVPQTIELMEKAGYTYYDEIILLNVCGTLPIRVGRQFNSGRKIGRMHQNILVFYKGDTSKIKEIYGPVLTDEELDALSVDPDAEEGGDHAD